LHSSLGIRASRANGAGAGGPVTPKGKRRSSQNAFSHGLLVRSKSMVEEMGAPHVPDDPGDRIANAWYGFLPRRLSLSLRPSPGGIASAPNPGMPNEPSPISGHLPEGQMAA
jgi:hypothetical protein